MKHIMSSNGSLTTQGGLKFAQPPQIAFSGSVYVQRNWQAGQT